MSWVLYAALFMAIFYFLSIAPQKKQQKERQAMMDSLKAGDRVVTLGGIFGRITEINDRTVFLEVAPGVKIEVLKTGIGYVEPEEDAEAKEESAEKNEALDGKKDE